VRIADALRSMVSAIRSGGWFGPYGSGDKALIDLFGAQPVASGVAVNEYTALNISAVWSAVTQISGTIASLPLPLYKRIPGGGKERDVDHPTYKLLMSTPNDEMTAMIFRETLQQHVLLWGNGYAEIIRDNSDRPTELYLLSPDMVEPYRDPGSKQIRYRVTQDDGKQVVLEAHRVFHVPGLGFDGIKGYSVIRKARESLGLALATERFGSSFFGNGAWPGIVAQHPGKLSEEAHKRLKNSLNDTLRGGGAHSLIVTEEGIKIEKAGIPPEDAQFLETRKFQISEIARWFNIPPHKLRDLDRATYSNIEQQEIEWVVDLRLWLVRWEQECNRKLIRPLEQKRQFYEHLVEGLLRGDIASRFNAYAIAKNWGWMSTDDIRERENMNPLPNGAGKIYLVPQNMVPADRVDELIDAQVRPDPAPVAALPPKSEDTPADRAHFAGMVAELLRPDLDAARQHVEAQLESTRQEIEAAREAAESAKAEAAGIQTSLGTHNAAQNAEQAAFRARLDELESARQAQAGRVAALVPRLRDVLEGALRREARFEADRARRAAQSPEKLRAWIEAFYATREEALVQILLPALRLHFTLVGRPDDAEIQARTLLAPYVAESRASLTVLLDAPEDLENNVRALVSGWETTRPGAFTDELIREVIANA